MKLERNSSIVEKLEVVLLVLVAIVWLFLWVYIFPLLYFPFRLPPHMYNLVVSVVALGSMGIIYVLLRRFIYGTFRGRPPKKVKKKDTAGVKKEK